ncbi:hypothetical protein [Prescottella equi]|uniref:hypothetical protein n=2 Tax=Nocardiaceae TaxID=85025 RepID=UPI0011A2F2B0|nr:hypothetical protein [Prescottella equi]
MNSPSVWTCDSCSGDVTLDGMGLVVARHDSTLPNRPLSDWKIVHKGECDPTAQAGFMFNLDLKDMVGPEGHARLLSMLSAGPLQGGGPSNRIVDFDGFVDIFRRLHTPFYEEARRRFDDPDVQERFSAANEVLPYLPDVLETIVNDQN